MRLPKKACFYCTARHQLLVNPPLCAIRAGILDFVDIINMRPIYILSTAVFAIAACSNAPQKSQFPEIREFIAIETNSKTPYRRHTYETISESRKIERLYWKPDSAPTITESVTVGDTTQHYVNGQLAYTSKLEQLLDCKTLTTYHNDLVRTEVQCHDGSASDVWRYTKSGKTKICSGNEAVYGCETSENGFVTTTWLNDREKRYGKTITFDSTGQEITEYYDRIELDTPKHVRASQYITITRIEASGIKVVERDKFAGKWEVVEDSVGNRTDNLYDTKGTITAKYLNIL